MNISKQTKGPQIPVDQTYKQCFKQNIDSDRSLHSEFFEDLNDKRYKTNRTQYFKRMFQNERRQKKTENINIQSKNFLKLTMRKKLVELFKNNLLTNAYVLSSQQKQQQYFLDDYLRGENNQSISNTICKNLQLPIIQSSSKILVIFDFLSLILNLIGLWVCPFIACFQTQFVSDRFTVLVSMLLIQQFVDILITLNKSIIVNGLSCEDRKIIFLTYIYKGAVPDLLSLVIWILVLLGFENVFIVNEVSAIIQIYITIFRLYYKFESYIETLYIQGSISILIDLLTLVITIFFFTHITACMWNYVGENSAQEGNNTWLKQYNLLDASPSVKYNYSFYWATMTMVTVGYGDITPQNQTEMVFVIVIMFFSSCLFAYTMNSIGIILKTMYTSKLSYKRSLVLINTYMNKHFVQPEIQTRIRTFLKNKCKQEQNSNSLELNTLIEDLPIILKNDLKQNISTNLTSKFTSLTMQFSKNVISKLSDKIHIISLTPGEFIYHQGDDTKQMQQFYSIIRYFINEGRIELLEERSKKSLQILGPGESFGEYQCFTGLPPKSSALSQGFGQIICINRHDLLKVVQDQKKDNERFHHIKDKILMSQNYSEIFKKCNICSRHTHQNVDCPLISYKPDLEQRILKEQYFDNQESRKCKRENYKINTKLMLREIQKSIKKFRDFSNIEATDTNCEVHSEIHSETYSFSPPIQTFNQNKVSVQGYARKSQKYLDSIRNLDNTQQPFKMLDQLFDQLVFHQMDIDKGQTFENYMPHNNPYNVIKLFEKARELHYIRPKLKRKYSFKYKTQIQARQLLKLFPGQIDNR